MLISVVARTQGQGLLGAFFVVVLEIILAGQILPVEYMPRAVQMVSYLMPNGHYTAIVPEIMLRGSTQGNRFYLLLARDSFGRLRTGC